MGTCPNCGLWEGMHASGEYCRCNEDGWHNAQPIPQPEPDVPADAHIAQCAAYQSHISALEAQVKALTEERDQACRERADAQHRYTVAMHDISKACEGTTARSACEVVELWRKERNAQAEAVRDIVAAIKNEPELPGLMPDEMWAMLNGNRDLTQLALVRAVQATKEGIIKNAKNNPIVRAAVERGAEG